VSAYLSYEQYLAKPEDVITPPRINNLQRILTTLHDQAVKHPENPALTIRQIRMILNLQNSQVNAAMLQYGMKALFAGKGPGFTLSEIGREVIAGTRQLSITGITANPRVTSRVNTHTDLLTPLSPNEYHALKPNSRQNLQKEGKLLTELIYTIYVDAFKEPPNDEIAIRVARSLIFQITRALTNLTDKATATRLSERELDERLVSIRSEYESLRHSPISESKSPE